MSVVKNFVGKLTVYPAFGTTYEYHNVALKKFQFVAYGDTKEKVASKLYDAVAQMVCTSDETNGFEQECFATMLSVLKSMSTDFSYNDGVTVRGTIEECEVILV